MIALVLLFSVMWGSFLNMLAYRLVSGDSLWRAWSFCPHCDHDLSWYDLIPLFSYIFLRGRCRYCRTPISFLYPFIEFCAAGLGLLLWWQYQQFAELPLYVQYGRSLAYAFLYSGLLIAVRTDFHAMVIPRFVLQGIALVGLIASLCGVLSINIGTSLWGAVLGYVGLWSVARFYLLLAGKKGIGEGDIELMLGLGTFFGPIGVWATLLVGSFSGTIITALYLYLSGKGVDTRVPFGPFLALGSITYIVAKPWFYTFFY